MSLRVTSRRVSGDSCSCVSRPGWPTGLELRPRSFMTVAMGVSGLVVRVLWPELAHFGRGLFCVGA